MFTHNQRATGILLAAALGLLAMAGCERRANTGAGTALAPAARVDGTTVSEQALKRAVPQADATQAAQRLERMIDEQLLANAAVAARLDAEPDSQADLEQARRSVLARAYIRKRAGALANPTAEEVAGYYRAHPELFSNRHVYRLQEIAVQTDAARLGQIEEKFRSLATFEQRAAALKEMGVPFRTGAAVKGAEELPSDLLASLGRMPENGAFMLKGPGGATFVQVTGVEAQPLTEAQARPVIERFLGNQHVARLVQAETRRLRGGATIEYVAPHAAPAAPATGAGH